MNSKRTLLYIMFCLIWQVGQGQTNPTPQTLPYSQDFSTLAWTATTYPAGWRGWTISTAPGATFNTSAPTADRALTANSNAATNSGNIHNYDGKIGFLNSSALDLGIVIVLNTSGFNSISFQYDIMTIRNPYDGSSNTRINEVTLQYRIGTSGAFTSLTGIEYQNNTTTQIGSVTTPQNSQTKSITLPSSCDNQPVVQLRWASRQVSGGGSRPSFAVDNISASGTAIVTPIISVTSVTSFGNQDINTISAEKSYTVSGSNLTGDITLTPPPGFEISTTSGSGFVSNPSTITLTQSGGSVPSTTVYVRFAPVVSMVYAGNITHASTGASTQNVAVSGNGISYFYSKATGNLDDVTTWGTNTDGSGTNPANFTSDCRIYNIRNNASPSIGNNWTVSGTASKVICGDGTNACSFTIPSAYSMTGTIDVSANSSLIISNNTVPTLGTVNSSSTVVYDGSGPQTVQQLTYSNLTLSSSGTKTFSGNTTTVTGNLEFNNTTIAAPGSSPFATINLGGNLTYIGTVTSPTGANSMTLITSGTGTQTIIGNGNTMHWFRLTTNNSGNNIVLSSNGSTLDLGNTSGGGITLATGSYLTLNDNTLSLTGNSNISGLGTISCSSASNITISKNGAAAFGTLRLTNGNETLNNLTIDMQGTGNNLTLSSLTVVNGNLTITNGKLTVPSACKLTVNGTVTNTVGNTGILIQSGGSLIQSTASVPATVERQISAWIDEVHGWHFLSSPVAAQTIDPAFTDPTAANYDFYKWDEPTNTWLNQKVGANNITAFIPGTGYLTAYGTAATKQFTGNLNNDDVSVSGLTDTPDGANHSWNLVGNPFPCAIKWNDGVYWTVPAAFSGVAKVWSESGAAYVDVPAGGIIPAMNGFMVKVITSPATLTIPKSARIHDATSWYKSSEDPRITLVANDIAGNTAQESVIRFAADATAGFDNQFDSPFLSGYAPQFYSVAGNENLSTNALPNEGGDVQIPFSFIKNNNSDFSIEAKNISGIWGPVYLNDLKTGASQDLSQNPVYSFTSASGDDPARFKLTFGHVGVNENNREDADIWSYGNSICFENNGKSTAEVFDMTGKKVFSVQTEKSGLCSFHTSLPDGYYIVRVISGNVVNVQKIHINR